MTELRAIAAKRLKGHLPQVKIKALTEKQVRVVCKYSSDGKLHTVLRWRIRVLKAGMLMKDLAEAVGVKKDQLSHWMALTNEPNDEHYKLAQQTLRRWGV